MACLPPPSSAVILMNLVPVFGVLFSVVILNEAINLTQIAGGIVIIIGVVPGVLLAGKPDKAGNV